MKLQNLEKITIYLRNGEDEAAYVHQIVGIFVSALDDKTELLKIDPLVDEIAAKGLNPMKIMGTATLIFESLLDDVEREAA